MFSILRYLRIVGFALILHIGKPTTTFSQEANYYGARNEALARASVALSDSWALFYNPAGLVFNHTEVSAGYQSKYTPLGINDGAFGFTFPIKNTAMGIGVSYFGDNLLSKSKVVAAIAHKIGKTSLGIKTTYDQLRVDEIDSKGILYLDIGGQILISKQVTLGMVINNITQSKFDTLSTSNPNTLVQFGINYHPHEKLILLVQVEKNISDPALIRFGLEYMVSKNVAVRTGVVPSPTAIYGGIGFNWFKMKLDLAGSFQQALGWSGGVSIRVPITVKNED